MSTGRSLAGVLISVLVVLALGLPALAATLSLSPGGGLPGTALTVAGSGFQPSLEVTLCWDGAGCSDLGSTTAGEDGTLSIGISVPAGANAGPHEVWACQEDADTGTDCAVAAVATASVDAVTTTTTALSTTSTKPTTTTIAPPTTTRTTTSSSTTSTTSTGSTTTTSTTSPPAPVTTAAPPPPPPTAAPTPTNPASPSTTALSAGPPPTTVPTATQPIPYLAGAGDLDLFSPDSPTATSSIAADPISIPAQGGALDAILLPVIVVVGTAIIGRLVWIRMYR